MTGCVRVCREFPGPFGRRRLRPVKTAFFVWLATLCAAFLRVLLRRDQPVDELLVPFDFQRGLNCSQLAAGNRTTLVEAKLFQVDFQELLDAIFSVNAPEDDAQVCGRMRKTFDFLERPLSAEEAAFPLAYGFHVYKDLAQVLLAFSAFYHPQNLHCVGLDGRSDPEFKRRVHLLAHCLPNVTVIVSGHWLTG